MNRFNCFTDSSKIVLRAGSISLLGVQTTLPSRTMGPPARKRSAELHIRGFAGFDTAKLILGLSGVYAGRTIGSVTQAHLDWHIAGRACHIGPPHISAGIAVNQHCRAHRQWQRLTILALQPASSIRVCEGEPSVPTWPSSVKERAPGDRLSRSSDALNYRPDLTGVKGH